MQSFFLLKNAFIQSTKHAVAAQVRSARWLLQGAGLTGCLCAKMDNFYTRSAEHVKKFVFFVHDAANITQISLRVQFKKAMNVV